jgi:hypothetical protein
MNNRIYQSPDLYTVLSNRLVSVSTTSYRNIIANLTPKAHLSLLPPILI